MAAHAAEQGPVQVSTPTDSSSSRSTAPGSTGVDVKLTASSIPVYVAPTYQLPGEQQQQVVHESVGYIQVPMQATAQQVYSIIKVGGACKGTNSVEHTIQSACSCATTFVVLSAAAISSSQPVLDGATIPLPTSTHADPASSLPTQSFMSELDIPRPYIRPCRSDLLSALS